MNLIDDIRPLAKHLQQLQQLAYRQYLPQLESLTENKIKDDSTIQGLLDGILDFCGEEKMLLLFKKLCRYYFDINPQATARYIHFYREMWDS
ncbi:hypothetical protein [Arachidicoccus sp.]|uniref:hypothetical protein n=1 Tax=Arachidicoccus sp. TaxID=1872624 RepID=UPI003D23D639